MRALSIGLYDARQCGSGEINSREAWVGYQWDELNLPVRRGLAGALRSNFAIFALCMLASEDERWPPSVRRNCLSRALEFLNVEVGYAQPLCCVAKMLNADRRSTVVLRHVTYEKCVNAGQVL